MHILYLGAASGTSGHRAMAMERLGHLVTQVNPFDALPTPLLSWGFKSGYMGIEHLVRAHVNRRVTHGSFDLVWIDGGEYCGRGLLADLKRFGAPIVNYCQDNPYVPRDGLRWRLFLKAIPDYDLMVTPRASNVAAAKAAGAKNVYRVMFAADELVHRPTEMSAEDRARFVSDVSFVGTWMPERGPFLSRLVERGVPLTIFGGRWDRSPEYKALKSAVKSEALSPADYVKAIQCTSIAIGLLSKGNQDLHTTRSVEIPAIGTLLCAERTSEHLEMYEADREAVFWADADECADRCLDLLQDSARIAAISAAGHLRAKRNGYFNEQLFRSVWQQLSWLAAKH